MAKLTDIPKPLRDLAAMFGAGQLSSLTAAIKPDDQIYVVIRTDQIPHLEVSNRHGTAAFTVNPGDEHKLVPLWYQPAEIKFK